MKLLSREAPLGPILRVPRLATCGYVTHAVYHARLLRDKLEVPPKFYAIHEKAMHVKLTHQVPMQDVQKHMERYRALAKAQRAILN